MVSRIQNRSETVRIALVGKYVKLHDAYLSVAESLRHAGYEAGVYVDIAWVESDDITDENVAETLAGCDGVLVPGGFGDRGIPGMIRAAHYAREHNIPYLGICLGMQIAVIEFARHACGIADADSHEFAPMGENLVIDFMPGQNDEIEKGGTMRLGAYPCHIEENTLMHHCYGTDFVSERHRHRYEFNNDYREVMEDNGLVFCGRSPDDRIVEAVEYPANDFYIGVQFHPEFKSRPNRPHPLFLGLVRAAMQRERTEKHS